MLCMHWDGSYNPLQHERIFDNADNDMDTSQFQSW
jgi:hypothetical protein